MGNLTAIFVSLLVIISAISFTNGCSCMQSHPQQYLCREGTYAALVKVRNVEYVYITDKPKDSTKNTTDYGSPANMAVIDKKDETEGSKQQKTKKVEVVVTEKELQELQQQRFVVGYIRYRVKVYETYHGLKPEEVQGKKVYIYTAPYDSLCGVTLKAKEMYLLIGGIDQDDKRLSIGLCNHHISWNSLEAKQKKVIRRNMREAKSTCESECEVEFCYSWSNCKKNKNSCLWTSHMDRTNYKLKIDPANYACKRESGKQDARCTWTDGLNDAKRGRRRRRNHSSGGARNSRKSRNIP